MKVKDKFEAFQKPGKTRDGVESVVLLAVTKKGKKQKSVNIIMFPNEPARCAPFTATKVYGINGTVEARDNNLNMDNNFKGDKRIFRPSMWRLEPV